MSRYAVDPCPNKEIFVIHVDCVAPKIPHSYSSDKEPDSKVGKELKRDLLAINGIVEAYTDRKHKIVFTRGGVFTIEELMPAILDVLQKHLPFTEPRKVEPFA